MARIVLFGGSFNPPHPGHLAVARAALRQMRADAVYFVPCGRSAYGKALMPAALRLRLLRLLVKGKKGMRVSLVELSRRGVSRTIDTARIFRKKFPRAELFILIGADQVGKLGRWKNIGALKAMAGFCMAPRPGFRVKKRDEESYGLKILKMPSYEISSTLLRDKLKYGYDLSKILGRQAALILKASKIN